MLRMFHKLLAEAGLPDMRFHDLCHSAATILLTMDTYSHVLPTMQKDVMERLDDVFGVQP